MRRAILALWITILLIPLMGEDFKVGYFDSDRVFSESKQIQEAQKIFENETQTWKEQIAGYDRDIEELEREYEQKKYTLGPASRQEAEKRIDELRKEKSDFIEEIYGENGLAAQRNDELLEPFREIMMKAVNKVAVEGDFSLILDVSSGAVVYGKSGLDVTDEVITEMELTETTEEE